jgi:hypothetical protein
VPGLWWRRISHAGRGPRTASAARRGS